MRLLFAHPLRGAIASLIRISCAPLRAAGGRPCGAACRTGSIHGSHSATARPNRPAMQRSEMKELSGGRSGGCRFTKQKSWLGWQGSNLRMAIPKTAALPLGYTPARSALYNAAFHNVKRRKSAIRHQPTIACENSHSSPLSHGGNGKLNPAFCLRSLLLNGVRAASRLLRPRLC